MEEDDITLETLSGEDVDNEDELGSSDGDDAAASGVSDDEDEEVNEDKITLAELEEKLGKKFPNKEKALKALKDTFSYVGKKVEPKKEKVDLSNFVSKEQYEEDLFFSQNKQYNSPEIRKVITSLSKVNNLRPHEVVETDDFKNIFEKVEGYEKIQSTKTVLETNPRLVSSVDKLSKAKESADKGHKDAAENLATQAVLDAYDL